MAFMVKIFILSLCLLFSQISFAEVLKVKSFDGFELTAVESQNIKTAKKIVVFFHGSGSNNYDEDLSELTEGQKQNLFFKTISEEFEKNDIASFRYNKRNYEIQEEVKKNKDFVNSDVAKNLRNHPYESFVKDAKAMIEFIHSKYQNAEIYLLGHSEGTMVSLRAASELPYIKGAVLIGMDTFPFIVNIFEQIVYRPLKMFQDHDKNKDNKLSEKELSCEDSFCKSVKSQIKVVDLNGDNAIDENEFKAGNLLNLFLVQDISITDNAGIKNYSRDEMGYPGIGELLSKANYKIIFAQGTLDNQTPYYQVKSLESLNKLAMKKPNLEFFYFEGLGHGLDRRKDFNDIVFKLPEINAIKKIIEKIK